MKNSLYKIKKLNNQKQLKNNFRLLILSKVIRKVQKETRD
jgi:hypothetical protein